MDSLEERVHKQLRKLETKSGLYLVTRQQFHPISRRWHHMGKDPAPPRPHRRWRNCTSLQTPNGPAESKFPGTYARTNSQLLSSNISNTLVKNATSIQSVWNMIRAHFGFQITGAHFMDFANLQLEADERLKDLSQRLIAFVEDIFLRAKSLSHHGEASTKDEELTPTLEDFIVLTWLKLIHPELPKLVKQRYGTELRSRTLASKKPEISQALTSLLDEIRAADDAKIMSTAVSNYRKPTSSRTSYKTNTRPNRPIRSCPLCKQAGRPDNAHFPE